MNYIDKQIQTYEKMKPDLEAQFMGKWVLIHDEKLIGKHDTFELAAEDAVKQFGSGPYLIRQVGASPITLPASVMIFTNNG